MYVSFSQCRILSANYEPLFLVKGKPVPGQKFLSKMPHHKPAVYGSLSSIAGTNKAVVQRTWGLLQSQALAATSPSPSSRFAQVEAEKRGLAYGPDFVYEEFMYSSNAPKALFSSFGMAMTGFMLSTLPPARWLLGKFGTQPGQGGPEWVISLTLHILRTQ